MNYRLVALDLDGTTVDEGQMPTPRVREAVAAARARGVYIILATGRPFQSARKYSLALALRTPLICYQGALVKEVTDGQATLLAEALPPEPLAEVIALAAARGLDLTLYSEDTIYVTSLSRPTAFYDLWFGLPARRVSSLDEAVRLLNEQGRAPLKGLFIGEPEGNDRLTLELAAGFAGRLNVVRSHPLFVEIISPRVSKGRGVAYLADLYGVSQAQTIAVGDSGNDLSMVQWAGLGVAMGNASADIKAAAGWIAPPVNEDGVAAVIERFVL